MTRLLLVRHAHAGDRGAWVGDDGLRPLSSRGAAQAEALVPLILARAGDTAALELVSSPAMRCAATLAPLGVRLGVPVTTADWLAEGASGLALRGRIAGLTGTAVWCSHGDVIPDLLLALADDGLDLGPDPRCQKASVWMLDVVDGRITTATHIPPPRP